MPLPLLGTRNQVPGMGVRTRMPVPLYWLHDLFVTAVAAPLVTRSAEPGPGQLTVVDTEAKQSIVGGALVASGGKATPATGDPGAWYGGVQRLMGRAMIASFNPGATNKESWIGWDTNQSGGLSDGLRFVSTGALQAAEGGNVATIASSYVATVYSIAVVLRPTGTMTFIKGGAFSTWTLLWVGDSLSTATMFPAVTNNNAPYSLSELRGIDLKNELGIDFGIAPGRLAGARTAGDTFTHTADCLLDFTVTTLPASGSLQTRFRKQDANNYWYVDIASSGALNLYEVVAGVATSRANGTGVVATNRIRVIPEAAVIKVFRQQTQVGATYSSATNFQTATAGEIASLGSGGAISNVIPWPRTWPLPAVA